MPILIQFHHKKICKCLFVLYFVNVNVIKASDVQTPKTERYKCARLLTLFVGLDISDNNYDDANSNVADYWNQSKQHQV